MALQRLSTEAGARKLMQRLIDAGRCTIDHLDTPPPGHLNPSAYRNLLRDPGFYEEVQPTNPRDFSPLTGPTPAHTQPLPLTLHGEDTSPPDDFDF